MILRRLRYAMNILVSNDDGYQAPGIVCLARALAEIASVVVVAPDRDRSGASNSLNLRSLSGATTTTLAISDNARARQMIPGA